MTQRQDRPAGEPRRSRRGAFGRLEDFLKPLFGGAQVGPAQCVCDLSHQPARAHRFDSSQRGRMYCPPTAAPAD